MLVVSLTLNVRLDLCQNFCSVTEIKYLGRNGRVSCLILFAGRNVRIFMLVVTATNIRFSHPNMSWSYVIRRFLSQIIPVTRLKLHNLSPEFLLPSSFTGVLKRLVTSSTRILGYNITANVIPVLKVGSHIETLGWLC
jgi:hypothetical protein